MQGTMRNDVFGKTHIPFTIAPVPGRLPVIVSRATSLHNNIVYMDALSEGARQPYQKNRSYPEVPSDYLNQILSPVFGQADYKDFYNRTETNMVICYLALQAYKKEKGNYPDTLSRLVEEKYLIKLPEDCFASAFNTPLKYFKTNTQAGFVLYSVGPNGTDEKGKASKGHPPTSGTEWITRSLSRNDADDMVARINTY